VRARLTSLESLLLAGKNSSALAPGTSSVDGEGLLVRGRLELGLACLRRAAPSTAGADARGLARRACRWRPRRARRRPPPASSRLAVAAAHEAIVRAHEPGALDAEVRRRPGRPAGRRLHLGQQQHVALVHEGHDLAFGLVALRGRGSARRRSRSLRGPLISAVVGMPASPGFSQ
jgi:hypothetical protein